MSRTRARAKAGAAAALACALVGLGMATTAGCIEKFEAPSEYTRQRYVCGLDDTLEWDALVDECAADFQRDHSCLGLVGFRGTLQEQPVVVQTRLTRAVLAEAASGEARPYFAGFTVHGVSPYFFFNLEARQVGGTIDVASSSTISHLIGSDRRGSEGYLDDFVELRLRLSAGGQSENFHATSGDFSYRVPIPHSVQGRFHGEFGAGAHLDGCFAVFGTPADRTHAAETSR